MTMRKMLDIFRPKVFYIFGVGKCRYYVYYECYQTFSITFEGVLRLTRYVDFNEIAVSSQRLGPVADISVSNML